MIEMSVVIPSYRSRETIRQCLSAIVNQTLAKEDYEIIVVDSSDDGTEEIIRENYPEIKCIHLPNKTLPGEARNLGVQQSQGKLIAFIDTDCVANPGLLEGMRERLSDSHYAGVGGAVCNGTPRSLVGTVEYILSFKEFTPKTPQHATGHIPSCNLCLHKGIFEEFGPFPTEFFPGEDAVFNWRLSQAGKEYLFDPKLQVSHLNRTGFRKIFQHQYRYGRAFATTRHRFPMPGRIFIILPLLSIAIPFVRWGSILSKLRWNIKLLGIALLLSPLIFAALMAWAFGFWRQLQEEENLEIQKGK